MISSKQRKVWAEALRSGMYRQGKGSLVTDKGKFCCLGVACAVIPSLREKAVSEDFRIKDVYEVANKETSECPCVEVENDICEISHYDGEFLPYEVEQVLINLNDKRNLNFDQIADVIENKWDWIPKILKDCDGEISKVGKIIAKEYK